MENRNEKRAVIVGATGHIECVVAPEAIDAGLSGAEVADPEGRARRRAASTTAARRIARPRDPPGDRPSLRRSL
jgi:hypothetical protein